MKQKHYALLGIILVLISHLPFFILGEDSYILIHDHLDPYAAHWKMLSENDAFFDYSKTIPVMDSLPRSCFDLSNVVTNFLYLKMPLFWGIMLNSLLVHLMAFFGMFFLLDSLILCEKHKNLVAFLGAMAFAIIPFYAILGISSAGIPILLLAFYYLYNHQHLLLAYVIIVFFCLFSYLYLSGLFIGLFLAIAFIAIWIRQGKFPLPFFFGLLTMGATYAITNFHLFIDYFTSSDYISHRAEFFQTGTVLGIVKNHIILFFSTQYHSGALITIPIILLILYRIIKDKHLSKREIIVGITIAGVIAFSLCYNLLRLFLGKGNILQQFQFDRFYFLLPTLWILLFAFAMESIWKTNKGILISILACLLVLGCNAMMNKEHVFLAKKYFLHKQSEPTYRQFFDEELFAQIDTYIAKPKDKYKVASIGMFPSVASYNGFNCIDGYWNNYPLEYKHEFRKIISPELDKDEQIKNYFDNWGSRCYVFSSELGQKYLYDKNCGVEIKHLDVNTQQMLDMDCQYVFSAIPINNYEELGWKFEKSFTADDSWWKIYLYRLPHWENSK